MFAGRVLFEPRGVCVRRANRTRYVSLLYVGLGVQSRIVLLQDLYAIDICCPSLGVCAFNVNRPAVRSCGMWANMCSLGLCSCRWTCAV